MHRGKYSLPQIQVLWPVMGKSNFSLMREFLLKLFSMPLSGSDWWLWLGLKSECV